MTRAVFTLTLAATACSVAGRADAEPRLEEALGNLYGICLFENDANNPFGNAAALSRAALAPGLNGFIESNLAAIPLTPPAVKSVFEGGEVVNVITGFAPTFTENSSTVGEGKVFLGANYSFYDFSKIRGRDLSETSFTFAQDDLTGDVVTVTMPIDVSARVFTVYGTYGINNRLDVGLALPFVSFDIKADKTTFEVVPIGSSRSGCGYGGPNGAACDGLGGASTPELSLGQAAITGVTADDLSTTFLSTIALRLKYRFPGVTRFGRTAVVVDLRVPTQGEDSVLGSGDFGARFTLIGEAPLANGFTPYVNLGGRVWSGDSSGRLELAGGFTQLFAQKLSFSFDMLGEIDLQSNTFLTRIDNETTDDPASTLSAVSSSSIPSGDRDHRLDLALGLQYAVNTDLQIYGSTLFSLLDGGLSSTVVPTLGLAWHY